MILRDKVITSLSLAMHNISSGVYIQLGTKDRPIF